MPPTADAGVDQTALLGDPVTVDGSASLDPDDGPDSPLRFRWYFVSLPSNSALGNSDLNDPETAVAGFLPDVEGEYVLRLEVSDGTTQASDNVRIMVSAPSLAPIDDLYGRAKPGRVDLVWSAVPAARAYDLYRRDAGGFTPVATALAPTQTVHADTAVVNGTT